MPLRLFISHAHEDKHLATALEKLIHDVFPAADTQAVRVEYSSAEAPERGPAAGAAWLTWILRNVRNADCCIVLLTPDSVSAPWLTWEAGAVTGAVMGAASASGDWPLERVIPLLIGVTAERIPAPLTHGTAVTGEQPSGVVRLLSSVHRLSNSPEPFARARAEQGAAAFVQEVKRALDARMPDRPAPVHLPDKSPIFFVNAESRLAVEPWLGDISNGARVYCGRFTGSLHQRWILREVRQGVFKIATREDEKKCMSVTEDSERPGATILLWDYEGAEIQHWRFARDAGIDGEMETYRIINCVSGLCLMPRLRDNQLVLKNHKSLRDQDWWILLAPVLEIASPEA